MTNQSIVESRLILRFDMQGKKEAWKKFGISVTDGKDLLQKAKELEMNVIGIW